MLYIGAVNGYNRNLFPFSSVPYLVHYLFYLFQLSPDPLLTNHGM